MDDENHCFRSHGIWFWIFDSRRVSSGNAAARQLKQPSTLSRFCVDTADPCCEALVGAVAPVVGSECGVVLATGIEKLRGGPGPAYRAYCESSCVNQFMVC